MESLIERPSTSTSTSTTGDKQNAWKVGGIYSRYFSKTDWWLEIGSSLLAVLCLLGMIILLAHIQNQPLSSWNLAVSPNAFISVLSTASKACLIQPVSECISQLKWTYLLQPKKSETPSITKLQEFDNASRGPLGSFQFLLKRPTKSILPYAYCFIILAAIATDSFAQQILSFETRQIAVSGVYSEFRASQYVDYLDDNEAYYMDRAIKLALYGEPRLPDLSCLGSRCQYPSFASLGVTSTCQEVTKLSKRNCTRAAENSYEWCNFTTPGGFTFEELGHSGSGMWSHMMGTSQGNLTAPVLSKRNITDGNLLKFGILLFPSESIHFWDGLQILECMLKLCAVEYTGWNVTHGTIYPGLMTTYPVTLLNTTSLNSSTAQDMIDIVVSDPSFPHNKTFGMTLAWMYCTTLLLLENLTQHHMRDILIDNQIASPNITSAVAAVATAMSYRMIAGPNATVTPVPVFNDEIIILVHWAWISLPATLVCASCLFLLVIIYRTNRAEHLIWKSSLTPLLLSQESYPVLRAGGKPLWTPSYLRARKAVIVNHLTK
ncbi:hypothetical protein PG984_008384 [Apiospora sp. TS-2023a]